MNQRQIESLAEEKSTGAESLKILWKQAIIQLYPFCGDYLEGLVIAMDSPVEAHSLAKYLARENRPAASVRQFIEDVDQSGQSLGEWMQGFRILVSHLESTPTRTTFSGLCGYLNCCDAASMAAPQTDFAGTVESMLSTHGFDGDS